MIDEAYAVCGVEGPTYISFDVDALDPVFTPGTGTPEVPYGLHTPIHLIQTIYSTYPST